jgi:hypothetical protein
VSRQFPFLRTSAFVALPKFISLGISGGEDAIILGNLKIRAQQRLKRDAQTPARLRYRHCWLHGNLVICWRLQIPRRHAASNAQQACRSIYSHHRRRRNLPPRGHRLCSRPPCARHCQVPFTPSRRQLKGAATARHPPGAARRLRRTRPSRRRVRVALPALPPATSILLREPHWGHKQRELARPVRQPVGLHACPHRGSFRGVYSCARCR